VLNRIASRSPFSLSSLRDEVRHTKSEPVGGSNELAAIFRRLHSSSTKWMIRIIFKDLSSLKLLERLILRLFHFLLPDLLQFQNSFHACVAALETNTIKEMPIKPTEQDEKVLQKSASCYFKPRPGITVGLPCRDKARSITHCCQLVKGRTMSVEEKYDGEYCQIHVRLIESGPKIQIFSKSGRDSTTDRAGVYGAIVAGLAIGTPQCKFQRTCIMEGELLVWNDDSKQIDCFRKIRKHVRRAGHRLGCAQDSPVQEGEHLMVMLYDLLLLDDGICVREPQDRRRQQLRSTVRCIQDRFDIGTSTKIDFGSRGAADRLRQLFAATIARGGEGLVLKVCADPYLCLDDSARQIKLKKDYIAGLGDTVDFAIVGGRRDARDEAELHMGKLSWTSFYAACLENKDQVRRFDTKPIFRIVARIDRHGASKRIIRHLNQHGSFSRAPFARFRNEMEVVFDQKQLHKPIELFKKPFVVELIGAGFNRPADVNYWTLRFPRIQKIHDDRTWKDVVSFVELQESARDCQHLAPENVDQGKKLWLARLQDSDQSAQQADGITSQETSEYFESNEP
jgi:DNA ligase 4